MQELGWLILLAIFLLIEASTLGLVTIWFGGGALVAFLVALFTENVVVQMILFFLVSILLIIFTRPFVARYINARRTKTNVDSLIGQHGRVTEQIDNFKETGVVHLNGLEWTARTEQNEVVEAGEVVVVKRISGVKLIVELAGDNEEKKKVH